MFCRNTQCFFFFGQVACLQTLFRPGSTFSFLFVDVCWLNDKVKICLVSSVIDYKTAIDGMDLPENSPVNACEMAFKIDEAMWKTFKSDCAVTGQEKSESF